MILRKIVMALVAAAAILTASGVCVVAAAYALFALVRESLGAAGAAAVVCLAAAVLIGLVGAGAAFQLRGKTKPPAAGPGSGILDQLFELARERPIVSTGALVAAAALAIRNPVVLASVVKALLNKKPAAKAKF